MQRNATPSDAAAQPVGYWVDDLYIDLAQRHVFRGAAEVPLSTLSFDLLVSLARAAPNLVSFDDLMAAAWPGVIVSPETLTQRVKIVRDALGDSSRSPRYITGVRGRGYRLVAAAAVYESARPESASETFAAESRQGEKHWPVHLIAAGALSVALLTAVMIVIRSPPKHHQDAQTSELTSPHSVAVLPFTNMSGDAEYEYISDGLTEELLNRLVGVPDLEVVGRTSSFYFKDRSLPLPEIGRQLKVRYLLEGSIRVATGEIRVTAQLVDATTGFHIWSDAYQSPLSDSLTLQDEIAAAVVRRVAPSLLSAAETRIAGQKRRHPAVLDTYLRASQLFKNLRLDQIEEAIALYEQVIETDADFAEAYISLADALGLRRQLAEARPTQAYSDRIVRLLTRALEIDPDAGDAYANLGLEHLHRLEIDSAARAFEKALALAPHSANVNFKVSQFYAFAGWPPDECIDFAKRAERLDPLHPGASVNVAICLWHAHRNAEALQQVDRVIKLHPDFWVAYWMRAAVLRDLGRPEEALAAAERALSINDYSDTRLDVAIGKAQMGDLAAARDYLRWLEDSQRGKYTHPTWRAWVLVTLGDHAGALDALELAYAERDPVLIDVPHLMHMLPLHDEPRFQRLVVRLGQERRAAYVRSVAAQRGLRPVTAAK